MAFLALKPECVKSSFYNVKIRVEKVKFICCCLRHPELHKYPALCGCQVRAPMQKCSSQTGKNVRKMGSGSGLRLGISTGLWRCLGSFFGFCASAKGPPKVGGMEERLCLEGCWGMSRGSRSPSQLVFPDRTGAVRA